MTLFTSIFRHLTEQLLKQEEWDNKMKLGNQYRGLHADEYDFLSEKMKEQRDKERRVKDQDNAEVMEYREYVKHSVLI